MTSTAEQEKRWQIRGVYNDGKKLAFPVSAYTHTDAKKKGEQDKAVKEGLAKITDVVLLEPKKTRFI